MDDLVELKSSRIIRPRPPTLTSIPSLLSVFQNEWDALALETYTLRQHLTQTRQELSRALYEHDAAVRVIARVSRERDEAREALSRITIHGGAGSKGDAMQVDMQELPQNLVSTVKASQERYTSGTSTHSYPSLIARNPLGFRRPGVSGLYRTTGQLVKLCKTSSHCEASNYHIAEPNKSHWTPVMIWPLLEAAMDVRACSQFYKTNWYKN